MSNVTIVGNLAAEPELRFTPSGTASCRLTVCENRKRGEETEAHFYDVTTWKQLAENCAESLVKGIRVIVSGQLEQQRWETESGDKRSKVCVVAWNVGPDLAYVSAVVTKNERDER